MGIRIHRIAGFALTNVRTRDGRIRDPRINARSWLLDAGQPASATLAEHHDWLTARADDGDRDAAHAAFLLGDSGDRAGAMLADCVDHEPEGGNPAVLVITAPYELEQLHRVGDPIDHALARHQDPEQRLGHELIDMERGVGIHAGHWMDSVTGTPIDPYCAWHVEAVRSEPAAFAALGADGAGIWALGDQERTPLFRSGPEAAARMVPLVPPSTRLLAEHGSLFRNRDTWKTLHPVIHTYWA